MRKTSIEKLRLEYGNTPLMEKDLHSDPLQQFKQWLEEAIEAEVIEPNAMILATVSPHGRPATRTVLLKGLDEQGFIFYTAGTSRKGQHLKERQEAAVTFWWRDIYRQVNVEGKVKKLPRKEVLAYFRKRPRGAQLAALASHQSKPLASRIELEEAFVREQAKWRGKEVPCPQRWCGYQLIPDRIEFWQGRKNRLHDRFVYVRPNGEWILSRLAP